MSEHSRACGIAVMDNRLRGSMMNRMIGFRPIISRLLTLMLVLAVVVGSLGMGTMSHAAAQADDANAQHQMHDMAGMAHGAQDSTGGMQDQHGDCAMALCCFSDMQEPHADYAGVTMSARYAVLVANPAMQPTPDRADKPPKRT